VGPSKRAGIIAGIIVVSLLAIVAYAYQDRYSDDARLAELRATYFPDQGRLGVVVILHNADGEFTKANGHLELTIYKGTSMIYSNEYDFTKDDFLTWDNLFLGKERGVPFAINERFPGKSFSGEEYDVYANLKLNSGRYWENLHASFYSFE